MLKKQRHQKIVLYVNQHEFAKVEELAQFLAVSEITIRRDINELDESGALLKVHGGASVSKDVSPSVDIDLKLRQVKKASEKSRIAAYVATQIPDHSIIFLDAGTTVSFIIPHLKGRGIKVYTHGLHHIDALADNDIETYIIGGLLKPKTYATVGSLSISYLEMMSFDVAVIGFNSVDPKFGYYTPDEMEAMIKSTIIKQSKDVFFVGDVTKCHGRSGMKFASIDDGALIVDANPGDHFPEQTVIVKE